MQTEVCRFANPGVVNRGKRAADLISSSIALSGTGAFVHEIRNFVPVGIIKSMLIRLIHIQGKASTFQSFNYRKVTWLTGTRTRTRTGTGTRTRTRRAACYWWRRTRTRTARNGRSDGYYRTHRHQRRRSWTDGRWTGSLGHQGHGRTTHRRRTTRIATRSRTRTRTRTRIATLAARRGTAPARGARRTWRQTDVSRIALVLLQVLRSAVVVPPAEMLSVRVLAGPAAGIRLGETLGGPLTLRSGTIILQPVPLLAVAAHVEDAGAQLPRLGPLQITALGSSVANHHLGRVAGDARLLFWAGIAHGNARRRHGGANGQARGYHHGTARGGTAYGNRSGRRGASAGTASRRGAARRRTTWRGRAALCGIDNWQTGLWEGIVNFYYRSR